MRVPLVWDYLYFIIWDYLGFFFILQLESYMDDAFLQTALSKMGENQLVSIKVMKNKFTGEPASYGFINFNSDHHALMAMHRLNGKVIPDSTPVSSETKLLSIYTFPV